jgi:alpha-L-fucosidase
MLCFKILTEIEKAFNSKKLHSIIQNNHSKMKRIFLFLLFIITHLHFVTAQKKYTNDWASIDSRAVPEWFEDAKFGIFIHWGVYSVPAYSPTARDKVGVYDRYAEWYWRRWSTPGATQKFFIDYHNRVYGPNTKYQDLANQFTANMFQPEEWAKLFKRAGAKYVVLTSKHHEGFPLWPSKQSWNWNAMDIGPHRDLLGDLTKAVREKELKMGYYYSLLEWYHPLYKKETIHEYIDQHMLPQMKDLVNTYQPDVVWTDGEWDYPSETLRSTEFLSWLYNDSPVKDKVVVNDRWGKETRGKHGGFFTTEYDLVHEGNAEGMKFERPWEECRGMAGSFGYNRNEILDDYSTSKELVHILINKVGRGGNLLLNIGPTADGRIPEIMQQRLADMGTWLDVNGDAIYGTRKWEKAPAVTKETTTYYTKKGNALYVLCTKFPEQEVVVENISIPTKVTMLGLTSPVKTVYKNGKLIISPPVITPANNPCEYAWVFKISL